jgi:alkylation response protein AidB-like acyl-CoA dehydrogenase
MSYLEYDLGTSDEQRELQEAAHKFAEEVLRPVGRELDGMAAQQVVAPGSPLFDVIRRASELGYTRCGGPVELGGLGLDPATQHRILEELSWGNAGLAGVLFLAPTVAEMALASRREDLVEEFAAPYFASGDGSLVGCWAVTEPDHGSDMLGVMRSELRVPAPGQIVARRDGAEWVLDGQKSAWVSNAPLATHAMLNVQLEPDRSLGQGAVCLLPLDLPGVTRGRALEKHGARPLPQGEIFFEGVRIPDRWLLARGDDYAAHVEQTLVAFNAAVGALATGLARAAYEAALAYTKERVQGGRSIFEHQSVRARLFHMFGLVQASRALSRQVYVHNLTQLVLGGPAPLHHSITSKVFCTRAAHEVATLAVQLHGGNGLTREYPVEMYLRDATAFTVADGENALLTQIGASDL